MELSQIIKRIMFSAAALAGLLLPALVGSSAMAMQPVEGMGHAVVDTFGCLERHNIPAAAVNKELKQDDTAERDDPLPLPWPLYVDLRQQITEPEKRIPDITVSSSFVPPDIVILTQQIRV